MPRVRLKRLHEAHAALAIVHDDGVDERIGLDPCIERPAEKAHVLRPTPELAGSVGVLVHERLKEVEHGHSARGGRVALPARHAGILPVEVQQAAIGAAADPRESQACAPDRQHAHAFPLFHGHRPAGAVDHPRLFDVHPRIVAGAHQRGRHQERLLERGHLPDDQAHRIDGVLVGVDEEGVFGVIAGVPGRQKLGARLVLVAARKRALDIAHVELVIEGPERREKIVAFKCHPARFGQGHQHRQGARLADRGGGGGVHGPGPTTCPRCCSGTPDSGQRWRTAQRPKRPSSRSLR